MRIEKKILDLKLSDEQAIRIQEIVDHEVLVNICICLAVMFVFFIFSGVF